MSLLNGLCSPVTDRAAPSGWAGSGPSLLLLDLCVSASANTAPSQSLRFRRTSGSQVVSGLRLCSPSVLSWLFGVFASMEAENPHVMSLQCRAGMSTQMASDPWIVLARPDISTGRVGSPACEQEVALLVSPPTSPIRLLSSPCRSCPRFVGFTPEDFVLGRMT